MTNSNPCAQSFHMLLEAEKEIERRYEELNDLLAAAEMKADLGKRDEANDLKQEAEYLMEEIRSLQLHTREVSQNLEQAAKMN